MEMPIADKNDSIFSASGRSEVQRQQEIHKQIQMHRNASQISKSDSTENVKCAEYVIPMRLTAIQKRVYRTILNEHASVVEDLMRGVLIDDTRQTKLAQMISSLNLATMHPLLATPINYATQLTESDEAWYIVQASSKFEFFVEAVETLRHQPIRLGVLCPDQALSQLLRIVCRGLQIRYTQLDTDAGDQSTQDNSIGELDVILISSAKCILEQPLDICLAFDNTSTFPSTPLVRLIACNSAEHIERQKFDLLTTVSMIVTIHESIGVCSTDASDIVQQIVRYLCGDEFHPEQLREIMIPSSQSDEVAEFISAVGDTQISDVLKEENEISKIEDPPQILVTEVDGMEVHTEAPPSVSVVDFSDTHGMNMFGLSDNPNGGSQFVSPHNLEHRPVPICTLHHSELFTKETTDSQHIAKLEDDIERMMVRFDELRESSKTLGEQKHDACDQLANLQKRFERILVESQAARAEKNALKVELEQMRMPALPEESSEEYVRTENTRLKSELEKVKKSSVSNMQDFEFLRQQYQQSSSAAAELSSENVSLRTQVEKLENQLAGGLGYKLAILQVEAARSSAVEDCKNLELRNNILIEQLRRMRDDKLAQRGRGEGRRDLTQTDRKRASSAQEVGSRKKVDKVGASPLQRLSVASLITPSNDTTVYAVPTSSAASAYLAVKRSRTPF